MVEVTHMEVSYLGEEHFNKGNSITEAWRPSMLGMPGNTEKVRLVGAERWGEGDETREITGVKI